MGLSEGAQKDLVMCEIQRAAEMSVTNYKKKWVHKPLLASVNVPP